MAVKLEISMSIKLIAEVMEIMSEVGCSCSAYRQPVGAESMSIHNHWGGMVTLNNIVDHNHEQFDYRLQLIIDNGLFGLGGKKNEQRK
jgi:hypothetical protein